MYGAVKKTVEEIREIYRAIDNQIARFKKATGLSCPAGCSICCNSDHVEATVSEIMPLAVEICARGEEERVFDTIEEKEVRNCLVCVCRCSKENESAGGCTYYEYRPLVCRLFGFSSRRDKYGLPEPGICKTIKEKSPDAVRRAAIAMGAGLRPPVVQDCFMRVASVDSYSGYRRLPINMAIKEALNHLYWKRPLLRNGWRKAV